MRRRSGIPTPHIRGVRRPFCPLPAGASPPSTASSGGHDAVPCLAGQSSRSRCRSHSMFDAARHHRTSITPGGMATGGLYSTYEIAAAIAARTRTNSAVWRRLRLSHTAYSITGTPPDQLAPGVTTRDRVAVESVPPATDRREPDGFSGVPVPNMSEAGSPLFALALAKFWGLLTRTCGCVPCSSVTAAWKSVCALSMEPILFAAAPPCVALTDRSCQSSSKPDIQIAILCSLIR
jgi:hypothetical protein